MQYETRSYERPNGQAPFELWLDRLDPAASIRVVQALARMESGNFGDSKSLGGGVFERRIHFGPGLRAYFGRDGNQVIIQLAGGTKRTQDADIQKSRMYWRDYRLNREN